MKDKHVTYTRIKSRLKSHLWSGSQAGKSPRSRIIPTFYTTRQKNGNFTPRQWHGFFPSWVIIELIFSEYVRCTAILISRNPTLLTSRPAKCMLVAIRGQGRRGRYQSARGSGGRGRLLLFQRPRLSLIEGLKSGPFGEAASEARVGIFGTWVLRPQLV